MSATIILLSAAQKAPRGTPCARCLGLRFVHFAQMNEAQRRWAPAEAVLPCPDCAAPAQVIAFEARP